MSIEDFADGQFILTSCVAMRLKWKQNTEIEYNENRPRHSQLLYYQTDGIRDYEQNGEHFTLHEGEWMFASIGSRYKTTSLTPCSGYTVDFRAVGQNGVEIASDEPVYHADDADGRLLHAFSEMYETFKHPTGKLAVHAAFYQLLDRIVSLCRTNAMKSSPYTAIFPAIDVMERTPENNIPIATLAKQCCLNETTFRRLFSEYTGGIPPLAYRNRLRIQKAASLLSSGECSIEQVAELTGFYDTAHFYRVFIQYMNMPPGQYKHNK